MATNIDKGLYAAPQGLEELAQDDGMEGIEIEIVDPEEVSIKAGGLEIEIEKPEPSVEDFNANLADHVLEIDQQRICRGGWRQWLFLDSADIFVPYPRWCDLLCLSDRPTLTSGRLCRSRYVLEVLHVPHSLSFCLQHFQLL